MRCPHCGRCSECGAREDVRPVPVWPPPGEPLRTIPIRFDEPYWPGYGETATSLPNRPFIVTC